MRDLYRSRFAGFVSVLLFLLFASVAEAQLVDPLRPHGDWRTVETEHFIVHYPAEMAEWTLPVVARLDTIHAAVSTLVGFAPQRQITMLVADPYNVSNGFALPLRDAPTMVLWPTPPEPRTGIGEHRGWGELLAVHEYGHLAHLMRPSRNPGERLLWSLVPLRVGPVARRAPRWVTEGYATFIEGRLTGSGRPHGTWRPAVLRQWALEGRLPTYRQLSGWDAYQGGAMAYLMGSAFLEWLIEEQRPDIGEESLDHLWRRMSARQRRSFPDAFAGVFGGLPEDLYGRFTVQLTAQALEAQRLLQQAGIVEGDTIQRLNWGTGDPTVSPEGTHVALVLRSRDQPSRLVVWRTEEPEDTLIEQRRERLLELDPEDVPAIEWRPRPKRPVATLLPFEGRPHESPRFLPDGRRILVTRSEPLGDGRLRPDLFVWDFQDGSLRRVTRGAAIRHPDPAPDGRTAVAVRCENGICDVVRVDLATGEITRIARGSPTRVFYRPRYSPGGQRVAVAVQENGRWRIGMLLESGEPVAFVDPDDGANRYDAAWLPDGSGLIVTSHQGGIPNLELLDPISNTVRPLTRAVGGAFAAEPNPADGSVYFLNLHSRGLDLNRIHPDTVRLNRVVQLTNRAPPAAPVPPDFTPPDYPAVALPEPRSYGLGPRQQRILPGGIYTRDGIIGSLILTSNDPVGRLGWMLQGAFGDAVHWNGASLSAAWRGHRPELRGDVFWTRHNPSRQQAVAPQLLEPLDADYLGSVLLAEWHRDLAVRQQRLRIGGSLGVLDGPVFERDARRLLFGEYRGSTRWMGQRWYLGPSVEAHGALGSTAGADWARGVGTIGLEVGQRGGSGLRGELTYGTVTPGTVFFERFTFGGAGTALFDPAILSQRIFMPAIPAGILSGERILTYRATALIGGLQPYLWGASTERGFNDWYRVAGAEQELILGPLSLLRIPQVRIIAGVGYPLDEPFRHQFRGYLSIGFRP